MSAFPDGLDALRAELALPEIMRLIEHTARWASVETFRRLPVWFPEHTRRGLFYKANWTEPLLNINRQTKTPLHKFESNSYASDALTRALGLRSRQRPNWSCCHIWGVDDPSYRSSNLIVQDARFYSCIANMVLLPTPLKAFTDVMPDVKWMLRACAYYTFGWQCDHEVLEPSDLDVWTDHPGYPVGWPRKLDDAPPSGTMAMTSTIARDADRRLETIAEDLRSAGPFYPRGSVIAALRYWKLPISHVHAA